jgi:hypothetical protein
MTPLAIGSVLVSLALAACASSPAPTSSSPGGPAATTATTAEPGASASAAPAPEPEAHHYRPLDLTNACTHEVHLYYGDQPGDGKGQSVTAATGATIPVPRGADGTVVVWVVDDKGFGLASVHVTRPMRHVRFDPGCMKLDADSTR